MRTWSASLRGGLPDETAERLRRILDVGFDHIVLHAPLALASWRRVAELLPRDAVVATSLFLPYPKEVGPGTRAPFTLDATDREERARFLEVAAESLRFADSIRARQVIVPPHALEAPRPSRDADRLQDAYRFALDRLLPLAGEYGLSLAVTPSCDPLEFPHLTEFRGLRAEFRGADVSPWFDAPRAAFPGEDPTQDAPRGLSIHDVRGSERGLLPGRGAVDWPALEPLVEIAPIWDLHLRPDAPAEEWARALEHFEGYETGPEPSFGLFTF